MNIGILIPNLSGGGAERVATNVGNYLSECGNNVYYFFFGEVSKDKYEIIGNRVVVRLPKKYELIMDRNDAKNAANEIKGVKKLYKIDVTISFMEPANLLNVLSKNNDRIIISVRTLLSKRSELSGFWYNKHVINKLYSKADRVVVPSSYIKNDMLANYGLNGRKIVIIPNTIKKEEVDDRNQKEWIYGRHTALCVGRLDAVKQHDRIIKAFSLVRKKVSDAKLVICGEGLLKEYLCYVVRKLGIDESVFFMGFVNNISYYYKNSRVFVMASKAEGFPNSMLEAMSYRCPVVSTACPGGIYDILNIDNDNDEVSYGEYGIVTPYLSGKAMLRADYTLGEEKLAEAMISIMQSEDIYKFYQKASAKRAECFSYHSVMSEWEKMLGG